MFHSFKFDPNTCKIYINTATAVFICRVPSKSHSPEPEAAIAVGMGNIIIQHQIIKKGWWTQEDNCCSWQWCRFRIMPQRYSKKYYTSELTACDFSRLIMWVFFDLSLQDELYTFILFTDNIEFNMWILAPFTKHRALGVEFRISAIKSFFLLFVCCMLLVTEWEEWVTERIPKGD